MEEKGLKQPVARDRAPAVESVMAIAKHPIHPMLVTFPIAFLSSVPLVDVAYLLFSDPFWARVGLWLNIAGLGLGVVAGIVGTLDLILVRVARRHVSAWSHFLVAVMALALAALGVWLRWPDPAAAVWPWGLVQGGVMVGVVMVAGWLGGSLSFQHGIGVYGHTKAGDDPGEDDLPGP
ncbi:DUF2231 domain-containing protein [Luteimonas dalianensis]|uniref:DUF2231 domain-containing protein n=1 Tax=Luteimonas dalianensis TaxID=1148196 RepID=UPI003BF1CC88